MEDVFSHTMLNSSLDDVRNVRRVLQTAGDDGKQAWRELQGETLRWIRDKATRTIVSDERGNSSVSPSGMHAAIKQLDADGKLDFIFGKKGGEMLRILDEVTQAVKTSPPGTVNTSNSAMTAIWAMGEMGLMSLITGGAAAPILSSIRLIAAQTRNKQLSLRVNEALKSVEKK